MKRLLAYLIVVISLGLTFSVNAETDKNGKQDPMLAGDPDKILIKF